MADEIAPRSRSPVDAIRWAHTVQQNASQVTALLQQSESPFESALMIRPFYGKPTSVTACASPSGAR